MRATILTLHFSPALGRFLDEPLRDLLARAPATTLREHFFVVDSLPYLLCVVTHAPAGARSASASAAPASATASIGSGCEGAAPAAEPVVAAAARGPSAPVQELLRDLDDDQRRRFEQIRRWRSQTAHREGVPPYVVLTNRQLIEIVRQRPDSRAGLGRIQGLGDKKLDRYAEELLALLAPSLPPAQAPAETGAAMGAAAAASA